MKRFWLVLLALGMLFAFSSSVFAADVKFTGSFYALGMYQDDTTLVKDATGYPATAFYAQRLRVNMEFIATPALKLVTRFDAMERIWGGARVAPGTSADVASYGTWAENQNIAFDHAYIWYASKIGLWSVGVMADGAWGTAFGDNEEPEGKIAWLLPLGKVYIGAQIVKLTDNSKSIVNTTQFANDVDWDKYQAFVIYNFKGGSAGILGYWMRNAGTRPLGYVMTEMYGLLPYVKAKIGPVALEAEVNWANGKLMNYEVGTDVKVDNNINAYVDALADLGMFYVGGTVAWLKGDKPSTATKVEGGVINGGRDWNPMLIMFNYYDRYWWAGNLYGNNYINWMGVNGPTSINGPMTNAWFLSLRGGVRPVADLDLGVAVAYAFADRKPNVVGQMKKDYGWEVDVTATYRITNNLSYMLGGAYLFTGDYFKGATIPGQGKVVDNYLLINKLTLTF